MKFEGASTEGPTASPVTGRGRGRPPRVTAAQIAEAALAIGLDRATIRNVAERLDMSVPGLYHHVRTRDDLLAMAAAHTLGELPLPLDRGQPWTEWMLDYGRFVFDAQVHQPELIGQILASTYNSFREAQHLEQIFEVLTARGFTVGEADIIRRRVAEAVNGAAIAEISDRSRRGDGHSRTEDLARAVQALGPESVPLVVDLVTADHGGADPGGDPFETVRLVVAALASRYDR
jgi:AcrR family transcriptional regulator